MNSLPLYIPEPLAGVELAGWFKPISANLTYQSKLPPNFFESVSRVSQPAQARAIVLPNNFKVSTPEAEAYIRRFAELGEQWRIPVFIFSLGDFTDRVRFDPRVRVFRYSVYRSSMHPQDIVMPTLTEDNATDGISLREKEEKPRVSFCGMGDLATWRARVGYHVKNTYFELRAYINPAERARKIGVYWRRRMMVACAASPLVGTLFIVRKTFSGNRKTIELDPTVARREYLDSIVASDFVLAPKGDGNYSNRFLKTLCMGRIPVLVDTDVALPFEDKIDYSKIVVRVPMERVDETPRYISEFYKALSPEEWRARQQEARAVFERYLRQDRFLNEFFSAL